MSTVENDAMLQLRSGTTDESQERGGVWSLKVEKGRFKVKYFKLVHGAGESVHRERSSKSSTCTAYGRFQDASG